MRETLRRWTSRSLGGGAAASSGALAVTAALLVSACSLASPIQPAATSKAPFWWMGWGEPVTVVSEVPEGEQLRIYHRGASGYVPVSAVAGSARARAIQYCEDRGRVMTPITEQTSGSFLIPGNFPRFEMVFVCTEKPPEADSAPATEDPYERLQRLKELLDAGVISQEEFDQEKREVLER